MIGLTKQQRELLDYLEHFIAQTGGVAPTFTQMMTRMGIVSKSGVHRLLSALEERGAIRRLRHRARAIEIVRPPVLASFTEHELADELRRRGWTRLPSLRPGHVSAQPGLSLPEPLAEPPAQSGSGLSDVSPFHAAPANTSEAHDHVI